MLPFPLKARIASGSFRRAAILALTAIALGPLAYAQQTFKNTPGFVKNAVDLGPTDPTTLIAVTVWLQLHNEQQLDQLVQQQNQKASPNFHKWITQDQFNAMFGPTSQEVNSVMNYLSAKKLTVLAVAENNMYVKVQGTVEQIQEAFGVQMHNYNFNGQIHRSNTADPSLNSSAGAHVAAISGMDDLGFEPMNVSAVGPDGTSVAPRPLTSSANGLFFESHCFPGGVQTHTFKNGTTSATYTGNRYGSDISNGNPGHLPPCG